MFILCSCCLYVSALQKGQNSKFHFIIPKCTLKWAYGNYRRRTLSSLAERGIILEATQLVTWRACTFPLRSCRPRRTAINSFDPPQPSTKLWRLRLEMGRAPCGLWDWLVFKRRSTSSWHSAPREGFGRLRSLLTQQVVSRSVPVSFDHQDSEAASCCPRGEKQHNRTRS